MSELERLKSLLLTAERERIERLETQRADLQATFDNLPVDLPELIERAQLLAAPGRLGRAIAEPVADALGEAVQRRRQSIVDALFPVIMPAIRRAIAEYLRVLSTDINRLLESSFTPRGIRWRIESWRTGVPYAEIAIKHSLRFRVDYLLLVQNESGLVLDRESAADVPALDGDAIAGMLTAIGDFVRDSVASQGGDGLSSATVGEHLLWVLEGPRAKLAAFIRGVPPESLKTELQARLEGLHARFGDDLALDPERIKGLPEIKDALTPDDLRSSQDPGEVAETKGSARNLGIVIGVFVLLLLALLFVLWRWQQRVDSAEQRLRHWPGFHLTEIQTSAWRSVRVRGLLDPLAESPLQSLRTQEFTAVDVALDVRGYLSTDPEIVAKRLRLLLQLPAGVEVTVDQGVARFVGSAGIALHSRLQPERAAAAGVIMLDIKALRWDLAVSIREEVGMPAGVSVVRSASAWVVSGTAARAWCARLNALLAEHPDFGNVDRSGLIEEGELSLDQINQRLRDVPLRFVSATSTTAAANAALDAMADLLVQSQSLAMPARQQLVVDIFGLNDPSGTEQQNAGLRLQRAQFLRQRLQQRLTFDVEFRIHAESTPLVATIQTRAALAQLRLE